jgi:hypothetical protein
MRRACEGRPEAAEGRLFDIDDGHSVAFGVKVERQA